jgi:predicted nucleic acid-binding Zn ribbon protein
MPPSIGMEWHSDPQCCKKTRKTAKTQNAKGVCDKVAFWGEGSIVPRTRHHEPDDDDPDDWDDEYDAARDYDPDDLETYPEGLYGDDGPPTVPCPHCRAEIIEDSEQCPRCGNYLSREDAPPRRGGAWVILMILALIAVAILVAGN